MATNPFAIQVPGGPEWAQRAWLAAYFQNQELAQKYAAYEAQRPDWRTGLAAGLVGGLNQGLEGFFGGREEGRRVDNTFNLNMMNNDAQAERQQALFRAQMERDQQEIAAKQAAAQQAEARRSLALSWLFKAQQPGQIPQPDALSSSTLGGEALFPQGGNPFAGGPVEMPSAPASYPTSYPYADPREGDPTNDLLAQLPPADDQSGYVGTATTATPRPPKTVPGMSMSAALAGMPVGLMGSVPDALLTKAMEKDKESRLTPEQVKQAYHVADDMDLRGDRAGADDYLAGLGLKWMGRKPETPEEQAKRIEAQTKVDYATGKPTTPEAQRMAGLLKDQAPLDMTGGFGNWLLGKGFNSVAEFMALPPENRNRVLMEFESFQKQKQMDIQRAGAVAGAEVLDQRQRAKEFDEAKRDFTVIASAIPKMQEQVNRLLLPGTGGRAAGLAKETLNEWLQVYPELNELSILGETVKGAITRRVLLENGVLTAFDVGRAERLIPKVRDNVETASAKLRVLQVFMEATAQAWNEYEMSGLYFKGRHAERSVKDFLPTDFWNQSGRLALPEPPPGAKRIR